MPDSLLTPYPLQDDVHTCIPVYLELAELRRGTGKPCKALILSKGMSNSDVQELASSEDDIGASSSSSGIYPVQTIHYIIIM